MSAPTRPGVVLLAGPPAVGHNTVAELLAARLATSSDQPVVVADGDDLRAMVRPAAYPGTGPAWDRQYELCVRNLCALAVNADRAGIPVVLVDVVEPEVLPLFRSLLTGVRRLDVVLLLAEAETLVERDRNRNRDPDADSGALAGWHDRIRFLRRKLGDAAAGYDHVLDNTHQTPAQTAAAVLALVSG